MENKKIPVLFIVFNRPNITAQVYSSLINNPFISKIYVACDGPRNTGKDNVNVKAVRDIIDSTKTNKKIILKYSEVNQGCKMGVKSAIDWFFENEECGVIIEDDCLPSENFFLFCAQLLEKYRYEQRVFAIDGSNYSEISSSSASYAFSKYTMIWGWATWKDRWSRMDLLMAGIENFYDKKFHSVFPYLQERIYWRNHLDNALAGKIDTWDFQWMYAIWSNGGRVVAPKVNMIKNIGFGDDATHSKSSRKIFDLSVCNEIDLPLIHPDNISFDKDLDRRLSKNRFNIRFRSNLRRMFRRYLCV